MTDADKAQLALSFMERANMTGAEVDAYVCATVWLKSIMSAPADELIIEEPDPVVPFKTTRHPEPPQPKRRVRGI